MGEGGLFFLFFGDGSGLDKLVVVIEEKLKVEDIFVWKLFIGFLLIGMEGECWWGLIGWLFGDCGFLGEGIELGGVGGYWFCVKVLDGKCIIFVVFGLFDFFVEVMKKRCFNLFVF